jgi:hypothetical protein
MNAVVPKGMTNEGRAGRKAKRRGKKRGKGKGKTEDVRKREKRSVPGGSKGDTLGHFSSDPKRKKKKAKLQDEGDAAKV